MGLRTKFNLVMITAFLIGLAAATFLAREITTEEAKRQMLNEANLIMRSGTAIRGYTQKEIRPLISDQMAVRFLPHSVPSWSAQTVLRQVQKDFPDYSYKEAALNPDQPVRPRHATWEVRCHQCLQARPRACRVRRHARHAFGIVPDLRPALPADRRRLPGLPLDASGGAADHGRPLWQRQRIRLGAERRDRGADRFGADERRARPARTVRCGRSWRR